MLKKVMLFSITFLILISVSINNIYAWDTYLSDADFYIYTDTFVSAYKDGEIFTDYVDATEVEKIDINDLSAFSFSYVDGVYTLTINEDITLNMNSVYNDYSIIGILFSKVNIVGEGTLTLNIGRGDISDNALISGIDVFGNGSSLTIGQLESELRTKMIIKDTSPKEKKVKSRGIRATMGSLSILNSDVSIETTEKGIMVDRFNELLIEDSNITINCLETNGNFEYTGICYDVYGDTGPVYNFINSELCFDIFDNTRYVLEECTCIQNNNEINIDNTKILTHTKNNYAPATLFRVDKNYYGGGGDINIHNSYVEAYTLNDCIFNEIRNINIKNSSLYLSSNKSIFVTHSEVNIIQENSINSMEFDMVGDNSKLCSFIDDVSVLEENRIVKFELPSNNNYVLYNKENYPELEKISDYRKSFVLSSNDLAEIGGEMSFVSEPGYDISFEGIDDGKSIFFENIRNIDIREYTPIKDGYRFLGWYYHPYQDGQEEIEFLFDDDCIPGIYTLYAKWEKIVKEEQIPENKTNESTSYYIPKTGIFY